jgi:cytochrome P450/ferredoxin-NADP reductase
MSPTKSYDADLYSDEAIRDPWPHYAAMRALGPVVWLPQHKNYALTRHAEVSQALRDAETFISGKGVAADEFANEVTRGNSVGSDGERHHAIRQATSAPLLPGALEKVRPLIEESAEQLIDGLVARADFDAVKDLATYLPLTIVRDLVGLPDYGRDNMLRWAAATFDLLGVQNVRGKAGLALFLEQRKFAQTEARAEVLKPGSWTRRLFELVEQGALAAELAPLCMRDYLNPSLDTTIAATGMLIYQLGRNPEQFALLRAQPELARNAANEAVRMASPVRSFCRHTARSVQVGDYTIPEGARVMMLFASANRDERAFDRPDEFDITRSPRHHLGFGSGVHMCVGMHLAQLEMVALLKAIIPRVKEISIGEPTVALNNTIYGFSNLPCRFFPVQGALQVKGAAIPNSERQSTLLSGRIRKREELASNIVGLEIEPLPGTRFPLWSAGAHIDLHLREGLVRQYSLTGPVDDGPYRIAVQLEPNSRGGSATVHSRLQAGTNVTLSAPRNNFVLDEQADSFVLFSGGIGLTPILAMAWRLHQLGRDFVWHLSARSRERLAWSDQIDALPFRKQIMLHLDDGPADQLLDAATVLRHVSDRAQVYICGPRGYMDHLAQAARDAGILPDRMRREYFGAEIDMSGDPFVVVAARSGLRIEVSANESILAAATRAGLQIETGCQNGVCGTCLTHVLDGRPDHRDMVLTDIEKAENRRIAVCCSRSQSATLVLDL